MSRRRAKPTPCGICGQEARSASVLVFWRNIDATWHSVDRYCGCARAVFRAAIEVHGALVLKLPDTPLAAAYAPAAGSQGPRSGLGEAEVPLDSPQPQETSMPVWGDGEDAWRDVQERRDHWLTEKGILALGEFEYGD